MQNINTKSSKTDIVKALQEAGYDAPDGDATRDELLVLLGQLTGTDYTKMTAPAKKAPAKKAAAAPRRTIVIPSGDTALNQGDVFVGVNGRGFQLKRDTEVEVPEEVIEVLRNAQTTVGDQMEDGSIRYRKVLTYPFNIVG